MLSTIEVRKQATAALISLTFERFDEKSTEIETLTDQSAEVLKKSTHQIDRSPRVLFDTFARYDDMSQQIAGKHIGYDKLVARQQQQGRSGAASSERTGLPEARGLIHEKDIKMLNLPEKHESLEVFRRW